jgi:hypothetical protein
VYTHSVFEHANSCTRAALPEKEQLRFGLAVLARGVTDKKRLGTVLRSRGVSEKSRLFAWSVVHCNNSWKNMGRKGKTQNHTAAEIAKKHAAAKAAAGGAGGGATMAANREAIKNKSMVACEICKANMPDVKSMQVCQIDLNVQDIVSNDS